MASPVDVLVIGHVTADLAPGQRTLGGTVSYAAPTYAAFGHRVGVLTSAADDEPLIAQLAAHADLRILPSAATLTYENVYSESGRRQFVRATASDIRFDDVPSAWRSAPYVHLGPLAAEIDPLEMARGFPGATVMLTLQGMMRRWDADGAVRFRRWTDARAIDLIDIIVYSQEDIQANPQLTDEIRRAGQHLVVTNGRHGGSYYRGAETLHYDSLALPERDLTGAGDVFAACLLGVLPRVAGDMRRAVRIAGRLAAYSITRHGLDSAPKPQEIRRELAAHGTG